MSPWSSSPTSWSNAPSGLAVLWGKGSFGTQSGSGARFAGAMLTVAETCRMHGLDLFADLAEVCTVSMADLAVPHLSPAPA